MNTPRFEPSANWKPKELEGQDLSNFRYIPDLTDGYRDALLAMANTDYIRDSVVRHLPRKDDQGEWDITGINIPLFLQNFSDGPMSHISSRIIDEHLAKILEGGVLVMPSGITDEDLAVLFEIAKRNGELRETTYESMPTTVLSEVIGGLSLAIIRISEGDPETVEHNHVHNGSRLVTCLSPEAELVLPEKVVPLRKGDAVWMAPFTLHSFQKGIFLALHTSEAGFQHPEAFMPHRDE